jgi:uncharacterized protein involved in type VI secretion and phage assembly
VKTHPGVVVGIVKSFEDPESEGRIQLQFPWLSDTQRSYWAPVAAFHAGKGRGAFFMPELGDEVLVAFEHGDFDHPFVVGFLWNGVDRPPESDTKNRIILTPGGHTLRFEDGNNKKIILKSNGGHQVVLDDSSSAQSITITTQGNQQMVLSDLNQSIKLQGGGRSIEMSAGMVKIT